MLVLWCVPPNEGKEVRPPSTKVSVAELPRRLVGDLHKAVIVQLPDKAAVVVVFEMLRQNSGLKGRHVIN